MARTTVISYEGDDQEPVTRGDTVKPKGKGSNGKTPGNGESKVNWKPAADALQKKAPDTGNVQGFSVKEARDAIHALGIDK